MNNRYQNHNEKTFTPQIIARISSNIAYCIAGISLLILLFYCASATLILDISYLALVSHFVIIVIFLAVLFFAQQLNPPGRFQHYLLTGLGFLYFAFFIDLLSQMFLHTGQIKLPIEIFLKATGLIFVLLGFKNWAEYQRKIQQQLIDSEQHDQLTTLYNRREFLRLADLEFERAKRYDRNLAIIFIDIDHFRQVNDSYGYAVGDEVLRLLTAKVNSMLRENDLFCRWDGEEFILIAPELALNHAEKMAEKIRVATETLVIGQKIDNTELAEISVTISLGCAVFTPQDESILAIIERADEAMYQAKATGRNRVCSKAS